MSLSSLAVKRACAGAYTLASIGAAQWLYTEGIKKHPGQSSADKAILSAICFVAAPAWPLWCLAPLDDLVDARKPATGRTASARCAELSVCRSCRLCNPPETRIAGKPVPYVSSKEPEEYLPPIRS